MDHDAALRLAHYKDRDCYKDGWSNLATCYLHLTEKVKELSNDLANLRGEKHVATAAIAMRDDALKEMDDAYTSKIEWKALAGKHDAEKQKLQSQLTELATLASGLHNEVINITFKDSQCVSCGAWHINTHFSGCKLENADKELRDYLGKLK